LVLLVAKSKYSQLETAGEAEAQAEFSLMAMALLTEYREWKLHETIPEFFQLDQ
jgi:hypothetical protein